MARERYRSRVKIQGPGGSLVLARDRPSYPCFFEAFLGPSAIARVPIHSILPEAFDAACARDLASSRRAHASARDLESLGATTRQQIVHAP